MLQKAALDAIIRHNYAESRLAIAKLQHNSPEIEVLEPVNQGEQNRELHVVVNWPLLLRGQAVQ
jgi:hypothetical protein